MQKTIVICEDDRDLMEMVDMVLKDVGYNVIAFNDEEKLMNALQKNKPDLLIIDYWLKKGAADIVVENIKQKFNSLPILLMSAIPEIEEVSKRLGIIGYIKKPFDIDLFKFKVQEVLNDTNTNNS